MISQNAIDKVNAPRAGRACFARPQTAQALQHDTRPCVGVDESRDSEDVERGGSNDEEGVDHR